MDSPSFNEKFYRDNPYGSSRLGNEQDAKNLSQGRGVIGQLGNTVLRLDPTQPTLGVGGAGSDKCARFGGYFFTHPTVQDNSIFTLDMGGQFMSISFHYNLKYNREAYAINPEGAGAYPDINHHFHLFGILKDDDDLFDNARRIAAMALKDEAKGENAWVGQGARRWLTRLLILLVLLEGRVTPRALWRLINDMDSSDDAAKAWGRASKDLPYEVYSTMVEIYQKKKNSEKEYGAIMGMLKDSLDWLSSPKVAESISGEEDILSYLADPKKKVAIYYVLKSGSGKVMESLTRMVVGIAMLHCMRNVNGTLPTFYLEEAATCGGAEFITQAVSECRKFFHTVLIYQSLGQIDRYFGRAGLKEIMGSSGQQIFFGGGLRDFGAARDLSNTIGKTTITLDDPIMQSEQAFRAEQALRNELISGGDPMVAAEQHQHELSQSNKGRYTQRDLIDPAELMKLKNHVVVLSPGQGLPPILADKLPNYWENPSMAGRFAPDPLFPPLDRVTTKNKWWGTTTRRFIREEVPEHLAHWPNHINGKVAYVEGFKTF